MYPRFALALMDSRDLHCKNCSLDDDRLEGQYRMTKHAALTPHRALWGANGVRQTLGFRARGANHPSNRAVADEVPTCQPRRSPLAEQLFAKDVQELLNQGYT